MPQHLSDASTHLSFLLLALPLLLPALLFQLFEYLLDHVNEKGHHSSRGHTTSNMDQVPYPRAIYYQRCCQMLIPGAQFKSQASVIILVHVIGGSEHNLAKHLTGALLLRG